MPKINKVGIRKMREGFYNIRFNIEHEGFDFVLPAKTDSEASAIRSKLMREAKEGTLIKKVNVTLNEFFNDTFMVDYVIPLTGVRTTWDYDSYYNRYVVKSLVGKKQIQKINPKDILGLYQKIRETTKAKEGTLKLLHANLRKIFNFAVDLEVITKSPLARIRQPKSNPEDFIVWTPEEVSKFLDHSRNKNIWTYYPMALTVMTGLRRSEVLGLQWKDIDFANKRIKLSRKVLEITGKPFPVIESIGKTDKSFATLPIPDMAINLFKDIQSLHMLTMAQVGKDKFNNKEGWVFLLDTGSLLKPNWATTSFRRNLNDLPELPKPMNLKGFRHLFATFLMQQNVHPKVVQELLRHSTYKLTMDTYSHVVESMGREAVSLIDQELFGAKQS